VILATTREMCVKKLGLLQEFCAESDMRINQSKTSLWFLTELEMINCLLYVTV